MTADCDNASAIGIADFDWMDSSAIHAVNDVAKGGVKVMAVDLPSGLDCDSGVPSDPTIVATHTATFVAPKAGFSVKTAVPYLGELRVFDIAAGRV